jgi:hypothetical protein
MALPHLFLIPSAIGEIVDTAVLQIAPHQTHHANMLADAGNASEEM